MLPPAEIDFSTFPADKQRIVGHGAKWDENSFEYHNTPRLFEFPASDQPLLQRISESGERMLAVVRFDRLRRVDFRVDERGQPWILEINTNPCISPDAGFAAAMEHAGIGYDRAATAESSTMQSPVAKPARTSMHPPRYPPISRDRRLANNVATQERCSAGSNRRSTDN